MKKIFKICIILILLLSIIFSFNKVLATSFLTNNYDDENNAYTINNSNIESSNSLYTQNTENLIKNGYRIDTYDVEMNIHKNGIMDIIETITIYAATNKHGIYRNIPIINRVKRNDGTSYINHAKITNLHVNEKYTKSKDDDQLQIKIGDSLMFKGKKTYRISYTYNIGSDQNNDYDELYYNIIGTNWDTYINYVTFNITMPKEFNASKLGFTHGYYGSNYTSGIKFNVKNNVITGEYTGTLKPNEGITVRCELPEGYFEKQNIINYFDFIIIGILIATTVAGVIIWYKFGRDKKIVETVEFYPPEGLTSLDTGYFYFGKITDQQVISLLIQLANKGYVKIVEEEEKLFLKIKRKSFKIYFIKDLDNTYVNGVNSTTQKNELSDEEVKFYEGLKRCQRENCDYVTNKDLKYSFYEDIEKIKESEKKKNKLIYQGSKVIQLLIFPVLILLTFLPAIIYRYDILYESLIVDFYYFSVFAILIVMVITKKNAKNVKYVILPSFLGIIVITFYVLDTLSNFDYFNRIYIVEVIIAIASCISNIIFSRLTTKRTEYGEKIIGKIGGFRNFLITAEKDKIEALVNSNPEYFYNILPYTYALGVSSKWMDKFKDIAIQPPNWYYCSDMNTFNNFQFIDSLSDTFNSLENTMSSRPPSDGLDSDGYSSGGFSGGGFSGGGSGGGGGSSW